MLLERHLTMQAKLERFIEEDEDFQRPVYAEPETIACRWEGSTRNIHNGNTIINYNYRKYITTEEIRVRDILDGQVVISVNPIYDFRGGISHYESKVGELQ